MKYIDFLDNTKINKEDEYYYIEIVGLEDTILKDIFENGQCFRWVKEDESNSYIGVLPEMVIKANEEKELENKTNIFLKIKILKDSKLNDEEKLKEYIYNYFDLGSDYGKVKKEYSLKNESLKEATEFGKGIRILKQEPYETIYSFIISANNNIPNIRKGIENISKSYGKSIEFEGKTYYLFPKNEEIQKLTEEQLRETKIGFRAPRIVETSKIINEEYIEELKKLDDDTLYEELLKLSGVGPKVANCIMLFGFGRKESFPIDVWVKRVMSEEFFEGRDVTNKEIYDAVKDFNDKGLAQQYLFYWRREKDNKLKSK